MLPGEAAGGLIVCRPAGRAGGGLDEDGLGGSVPPSGESTRNFLTGLSSPSSAGLFVLFLAASSWAIHPAGRALPSFFGPVGVNRGTADVAAKGFVGVLPL